MIRNQGRVVAYVFGRDYNFCNFWHLTEGHLAVSDEHMVCRESKFLEGNVHAASMQFLK